MKRSLPRVNHVGPIAPLQQEPIIYALDALESTMQVPESDLTANDIQVDKRYIKDLSQYCLSVLPSSKPEDHFILDKEFENQAYLIDWLRKVYGSLGIQISENIHYAPAQDFAAIAQDLLQEKPYLDTITTICFSYILNDTFPNADRLAASRLVNAKSSIPDLSKKYGLSVPHTAMCIVADMAKIYSSEFEQTSKDTYVKLDGLGGGANVVKVADAKGLKAIADRYPADLTCILQEAVPDEYLQTIHIYAISDTEVAYLGSRSKMVSDNQWYGNIFSPRLRLSKKQRVSLDKAAAAVQAEGYAGDTPLLLGIDAFMNGDDVLITEFNARWLGSSPTEYILRRLGIYEGAAVVAMSDTVNEDDISGYMDWIEQHLYDPAQIGDASFTVLPLGFSAYATDGNRLAGCIVFGDFNALQTAFKKKFGDDSFPLLDHTAELYNDMMHKLAINNGDEL